MLVTTEAMVAEKPRRTQHRPCGCAGMDYWRHNGRPSKGRPHTEVSKMIERLGRKSSSRLRKLSLQPREISVRISVRSRSNVIVRYM